MVFQSLRHGPGEPSVTVRIGLDERAPLIAVEFGVYEEAGAIVLGVRFKHGERGRTLMVQIADSASDLQQYNDGIYVEIDNHAFYGGVHEFRFDENRTCVRLVLDPEESGGIDVLQPELPGASSANDGAGPPSSIRAIDRQQSRSGHATAMASRPPAFPESARRRSPPRPSVH
jgi:hypothetical protein